MITVYGYSLEVYQVFLVSYLVSYGLMFGVRNTYLRVYSLFNVGDYRQGDKGKLLDMVWYGSAFVLLGTLV